MTLAETEVGFERDLSMPDREKWLVEAVATNAEGVRSREVPCENRPPDRSDRRISQGSPRSSAKAASPVREHRRHGND
jgi:hypothetical protein